MSDRIKESDGKVLATALARLRSGAFAFVGLVEEWEKSVCALHRALPGHTRPLVAAFRNFGHSVNSHVDVSWLPAASVEGVYNESVLDGFVDEADEAVYTEAAAIFHRRLHTYK